MKFDRSENNNPADSEPGKCQKMDAASPPELKTQEILPLNPSPEEKAKLSLQSALTTFRQAVEEHPDSACAWYQYGDALLGLRRPAEAITALRKAVELSPETPLYHYDLGLALCDLDQNTAANEEFAAIVACDPQLECGGSNLVLSALTNLALGQEKLGQREEAIETLTPAQETAAGIIFNLGFLHFRAKRYETAVQFAYAAYLLQPNNEDIVHQYGAVLRELNRPVEAVKALKQATELNPQCAGAWYDLGLAHARLEHRKVARRCFLESLKLRPQCPWCFYDLACLDALDGNRHRAFENLTQAVRLGFRAVEHMCRDGDLRTLQRDARWKMLIQQINDLEYSKN